jgi:hypothetical protein
MLREWDGRLTPIISSQAQLDTNTHQAQESILQVWSETIDILTRSLADIESNEAMV